MFNANEFRRVEVSQATVHPPSGRSPGGCRWLPCRSTSRASECRCGHIVYVRDSGERESGWLTIFWYSPHRFWLENGGETAEKGTNWQRRTGRVLAVRRGVAGESRWAMMAWDGVPSPIEERYCRQGGPATTLPAAEASAEESTPKPRPDRAGMHRGRQSSRSTSG